MTKSSTNSRQAILDRLRAQPLPSNKLPEVIHGDWLRFEDPFQHLQSVIASVGGMCERHPHIASVHDRLLSFPEFKNCGRLLSLVPGIVGNVDMNSIAEPHGMEDIDFLVVPGQMAVAENGAVWVTDSNLKHRVAYFINQHLVMVVRSADIVHNMHEAYARLSFGEKQFGCFISGPSKTADIEQSLVIGAHGCRTMQLYIVDQFSTLDRP